MRMALGMVLLSYSNNLLPGPSTPILPQGRAEKKPNAVLHQTKGAGGRLDAPKEERRKEKKVGEKTHGILQIWKIFLNINLDYIDLEN